MINQKFKNMAGEGRWLDIVLALCSVVILLSFAVYCFSPAGNSDLVEDVIWAETSMRAGRLLNPDYAYPYAIPFGGNLVVLPFVALLGVGQPANSCGMLLYYVIFLFTAFLFSSSIAKDRMGALLGTAVLALALRSDVGANQLHHILYYQLGHTCLLGSLAMLLFCVKRGLRKGTLAGLFFYGIWAGSNGVVTVAVAAIPTLMASAVLFVGYRDLRKRMARFIVCLCAAVAMGYVLYRFSMRGINELGYIEDAGAYSFKSISEWFDALRMLPENWFRLFVVHDPEGNRITSVQGLETVVSIAYALAAGLLPIYIAIKTKWNRDTYDEQIILIADVLVWLICLMHYVFFRKTDTNRMLYNGILIHFVLISVWTMNKRDQLPSELPSRASGRTDLRRPAICLCAILLSAFAVWFTANTEWKADTEVTDRLREQGLSYGVATFWNANYNTVNSSNRVKVRPITIKEDAVYPRLFQSANEWYKRDNIGTDDWFILLSDEEYDELEQIPNNKVLGSCKSQVDLGDYRALVYSADQWGTVLLGYEYNFSDPKWSSGCETTEAGRLIQPGGVSFGPYLYLLKDSVCKVSIRGENLASASIEVYSVADEKTFQPAYTAFSDAEIVFEIPADEDVHNLEIVVRNNAGPEAAPILLTSEVLEVVERDG